MKNKIITIYVHGTLPPPTLMRIPLVYNFFYCPVGMNHLSSLDAKYHIPKFIQALCESDETQFDKDHFYVYGWPGHLRFLERKKAAEELYNHLRILRRSYQQQAIEPSFKILTHSHGGNVALYLAPVVEEYPENTLTISELILLACPVQIETAPYVNDALFSKVFSIHSHHDILQIIDPQGIHSLMESLKLHGVEFTVKHLKRLGPLFSARHFLAAPQVIQLNVRYPNRELFHIEFLMPGVISILPSLIDSMKELKKTDLSKTDDITHILSHRLDQ